MSESFSSETKMLSKSASKIINLKIMKKHIHHKKQMAKI